MLHIEDSFSEISCGSKSTVEVQHIRDKRLWFLQQNQASDGVKHVIDQQHQHEQPTENSKCQKEVPKQYNCNKDPLSCDWEQYSELPAYDQSVETSVPHHPGTLQEMTHKPLLPNILEAGELETYKELKSCPRLSVLLHNQDLAGSGLVKDQPSPDQDQGYFSLEDWSNINCENIPIHQSCTIVADYEHQNPCASTTELSNSSDCDGDDSDLEELPVFTRPVCANQHIRYILGTVSSDEDDKSSCSDSEHSVAAEDDDDGFDSEGSVSETDCEDQDAEGVELWNSFYTMDPYNPQNFTAILHTGAAAEEVSHLAVENEDIPSDQESWCDSDALSASDSEDEYSADEEENLKLWNAFNNFDDPYNPLCFKASVQSFVKKNHNTETISKYTELTSASPQNSTLSSFCHADVSMFPQTDNKHVQQVDANSANPPQKKVTFNDEVTVYNVCSEEDRKGPWEEFARDRCRFQRRIQETEAVIGHCLTSDHRQKIWDSMRETWGS
ncbi:protein phosphatase 1 regulatory subunit 15B [Spea bombifrons]|uniref:protein phosphatase 1 regulatory subunit 15B n=1 Tax=Spea bombifrons TaxID=233779 RepID=UPI002349E94D|nr:protein phosphatase 1 regulatory subunit 15B [Spea bombifrons]